MASGPIIQVCKVISVDDPIGLDRIKVLLRPTDTQLKSLNEIPYVMPLLPKMLFTKPKVGEAVLIITAKLNDSNSQRFYIGPIIPRADHMDNNLYDGAALQGFDGYGFKSTPSPYKDPNSEGTLPKEGDVAIRGRNNADITLKDKEIRLCCGSQSPNTVSDSNYIFNRQDPAVITMKYNDNNVATGQKSTINVIADKINLIGNQSPDPSINLDEKEIMNDEEFEKFLEEGHKLPYGDYLIEFLKKFRSAFLNHTHPFPMMPPCKETECIGVADYDLDSILSDTVRIN